MLLEKCFVVFYVFSFPPGVCVGTSNLIASIPGPSILAIFDTHLCHVESSSKVLYAHHSTGQYPGSGDSVLKYPVQDIIKVNKSKTIAYSSYCEQSVLVWNYVDKALTRPCALVAPVSALGFILRMAISKVFN